jgi:hypothetical protein
MIRTIARPRPALDPAAAVAFVRKCESAHLGRMTALVCAGLPCCLLGPFFVTVLLWMRASRNFDLNFHFAATFWLVAAVMVPVMFLVAASVKGSILEAGADSFDTDSLGGHLAARRAALPMLVLEIGNIGPRMVLHFFRRTAARQRAGRVAADRLAEAVCTLASVDGGISPAKLLLPGESADVLEPLLGVLLFHELADLSKSGDRVWLTSPARRKLGLSST